MNRREPSSWFPKITWQAPNEKVYLTFDDGPDAAITPRLLDLLQSLDIKATFFVIGEKVQQNHKLTERIAKCGHTLGNHSYRHPSLFGKSRQLVCHELTSSDELLEKIVGYRPVYFRPPHGRFGINVLRVLRQTKHELVMWSASSLDYRPQADSGQIKQRLLSVAQPGKILLLHDGHANSSETLKALQGALAVLKKRGLVFSALSQNGPKVP